MRRRDLLRGAAIAGAGVFGPPMLNLGRCRLFGGTRGYSTRTITLVNQCAVVDMLGFLTLDWNRLERWQRTPESLSNVECSRWAESGVNVFHPAVHLNSPDPYGTAVDCFASWNQLIQNRPADLLRVDSVADLERTKRENKTGVLLGMQNSEHFRRASDVQCFHGQGQRISQLTYNARNALGCGCAERRDTGLTPYGAEIIAEMNRVGMAVDLSHASERTTLEAIEASRRPVLITHSNCRAFSPHPRCKTDRVIRALARNGGVMGITGIRAFVTQRPRATMHDLLLHYDHVARLVGVEHLGIGSDSDLEGRDRRVSGKGFRAPIEITGINYARRIFELTEGLIKKRYSDQNICMILGGNVKRVLASIFDSVHSPSVSPDI